MHDVLNFLTNHGYSVVFTSVLAQQLGVPIPAMVVLLGAGALAGIGSLSFQICLAVSVIACSIGDLVWYALGRRYGTKILGLLCRISLEPDSCVERTADAYSKYGPFSLVWAKFVPGLSTVVTPMAGKFKLSVARFLLFDAAGALAWTFAYMAVGWLFRSQVERAGQVMQRFGVWLLVLVTAALAVYILQRYQRRRSIYRDLRIARIAPWELKEGRQRGDDLLVVDLRNALEWHQGIIPGAIPLASDDIAALAGKVTDKTEIVLYCS